ncbi:MAG: hypothetical protein Q9220_005717 [cf. Caloplaca sp. 1 TL-2023]
MTDSLRAPIDALNYNNVMFTPLSPLLHTVAHSPAFPLLHNFHPSPPTAPPPTTTYTYLTAPSPHSPYSIDSTADTQTSTTATLSLPIFSPFNPKPFPYTAILIACFSPHPLVQELRARYPGVYVTGIFEAGVSVALQLRSAAPRTSGGEKVGIISTGPQWRGILSDALTAEGDEGKGSPALALGKEYSGRVFAGVETLGVSAGELHSQDETEEGEGGVKSRVIEATERLLAHQEVGVIVLGCAGMVGMEEWVRDAAKGKGRGDVRVVDGVKAGVGVLQGCVRGGF